MTQFIPGNHIRLLCNGADYFPAIETAFDNAKRDIYLQTYIFEDDETGKRIALALQRAAQRGVRTHLLVDGFGSKNLPQVLIKQMTLAGVRFLVFRPEVSLFTFTRNRLRRMHRKLVVIDGTLAFTGGINIIDDMDTPHQVPPRYDYSVSVEGPLVAAMEATARHLWMTVAWANFRRSGKRDLAISQVIKGDQLAAFLVRDNFRHRRDIENFYLRSIRKATSEIIIANAYFFPGFRFRRALIRAAKRGVNVMLILQGKVEYLWLHFATRALYGSLLDAGIHIYEYKKSFMHAKVAVIDKRWATVGSSNIDPFSLLMAMEANVAVDDAKFTLDLQQSLLDAIKHGSEKIAPEDWKKQSLITRSLSWISYSLARIAIAMNGVSKEYVIK